MKKLILSIGLLYILIGSITAQTFNGNQLSEMTETYVEISGVQKGLSSNIYIKVDAGNNTAIDDNRLFDKKGELMVFNSIIGALNLFAKHGYELSETYMDHGVLHFILKASKELRD